MRTARGSSPRGRRPRSGETVKSDRQMVRSARHFTGAVRPRSAALVSTPITHGGTSGTAACSASRATTGASLGKALRQIHGDPEVVARPPDDRPFGELSGHAVNPS